MTEPDPLEPARTEIDGIKLAYVRSKGWTLATREQGDVILLHVEMPHKGARYVLRLTCGPGMPQERPREAFVNPDNWDEGGNSSGPLGGHFAPRKAAASSASPVYGASMKCSIEEMRTIHRRSKAY